jgi:hypothetical protein
MKEYQQELIDEARRVSKLNSEYIGRIDSAKSIEDIAPLKQAYTDWLSDPDYMRQQELEKMEAEKARRAEQ